MEKQKCDHEFVWVIERFDECVHCGVKKNWERE